MVAFQCQLSRAFSNVHCVKTIYCKLYNCMVALRCEFVCALSNSRIVKTICRIFCNYKVVLRCECSSFQLVKTIYCKLYIYNVALQCEFSYAFLNIRRENSTCCKLHNSVVNFRRHFWLILLSYSYLFDLCKVCKKDSITTKLYCQ